MLIMEPTVGVSEFAQMIRAAGGSICNETLLAMSQSGVFAGYDIHVYRMVAIEGYITRRAAERWIADHSIEVDYRADVLEYLKGRETSA